MSGDGETRCGGQLSDEPFDGAFLAGVRDNINGGATRNTAEEILAFLGSVRSRLDIDGNGEIGALTDGLLILRYLFGFTGDALIRDAVGGGATRSTAEEIKTYLDELASS